MRLRDPLRDREAESSAEVRGALRLPEAPEELRLILDGDARARVAHAVAHAAIAIGDEPEGDPSPRRRELHGVVEIVRQHLQDAVAIGVDAAAALLDLTVERLSLLADDRPEGVARLRRQRRRILAATVDRQASALDPRDVEQVLDETVHPLRRPRDDLELLRALLLGELDLRVLEE